MDASDLTRLRKAKAWYFAQKTTLQKAQPTADCFSYTECTPATCKVTFPSYDAKYNYFIGKNKCNGTTCQINGCGR
jgi:hypothetical protein